MKNPNRTIAIGVVSKSAEIIGMSGTEKLLFDYIKKVGFRPVLINPPKIDIVAKDRVLKALNVKRVPDVIINRHDVTSIKEHDIQVLRTFESIGISTVNLNSQCCAKRLYLFRVN